MVEIDGEAVIFDERNDRLHHLNPTATLIFRLCDGSGTVREFAADIAEAYGAEPAGVERDIRALVRDFRRMDLLQTDGSGKKTASSTKPAAGTPKSVSGNGSRRPTRRTGTKASKGRTAKSKSKR